MTSVLLNDAVTAIKDQSSLKNTEMMPMTKIKVERIVSIADFKSKNIDFGSLRPAILINQTLLVEKKRNL
jgi:hypothetical protein